MQVVDVDGNIASDDVNAGVPTIGNLQRDGVLHEPAGQAEPNLTADRTQLVETAPDRVQNQHAVVVSRRDNSLSRKKGRGRADDGSGISTV